MSSRFSRDASRGPVLEPMRGRPMTADRLYAGVRTWIFDDALPFWAAAGVDRVHGGFVEQLALDGTDSGVDFNRIRVLCRQIYVFSHAALLGWDDGFALARHGYDFLTGKAWLGDKGGWARRLDREGRVTDATPDLYDIAFVIFALGWFHKATGDTQALDFADRTLCFLNAAMRHPGGSGFLTEKPASGPRLQNPHMHLLEAALVHVETYGHPGFRALADEIVELFERRFFDPSTQSLGEYFYADWTRLDVDGAGWVEPGHQFEWAWILAAYQRLTGRQVGDLAHALVAFAEAHGVDGLTGSTFNAMTDDGAARDRGSRLWPNTERIQAAVAMFELEGRDPRPVFAQSGGLVLDRYLAHAPVEPGSNVSGRTERLPEIRSRHRRSTTSSSPSRKCCVSNPL